MIDGGNISFDKRVKRKTLEQDLILYHLFFFGLKVYRKVCFEGTYIVVLDYL